MKAEVLIASFLRLSQENLEEALLLEAHGKRHAIYHCEQAAEMIIRAVMTSESLYAGVGHQLGEMVNQIPNENPMKIQLKSLGGLANYATSYRYPNSWDEISNPPDAATFADFAKKVKDALDLAVARFGVDLTNKRLPAQTPGPIR